MRSHKNSCECLLSNLLVNPYGKWFICGAWAVWVVLLWGACGGLACNGGSRRWVPTVGPGGVFGGGSHGGIACGCGLRCCDWVLIVVLIGVSHGLLVGVGVVWDVVIVVLIIVAVVVVLGFVGVLPFQVHRCFDHAGR